MANGRFLTIGFHMELHEIRQAQPPLSGNFSVEKFGLGRVIFRRSILKSITKLFLSLVIIWRINWTETH